MLVFSALVPTSTLRLPSIHKEAAAKVKKTSDALDMLADELYATHPDTILLISEHPTLYDDAFSINVADPYTFDLSAFGDLGFEISRTYCSKTLTFCCFKAKVIILALV